MSVERLSQMADDLGVLTIAKVVLDDPRFAVWSGSHKPEMHHYGKGGLAQHTWEVAHLCIENNNFFAGVTDFPLHTSKKVDPKRLFLAALFHDSGKMWDYKPLASKHEGCEFLHWEGTEHKRRIHHISRSALVWHEAAKNLQPATPDIEASQEIHDDVLHAILSHHGMRAWGSPVAPATRLAWLLHLCDGLSARMDDCYRLDRF